MNAPQPAKLKRTDTASLFQRFPHLSVIDLMWGSRECRSYIFRLMTDTRGGSRQGFPPEHARTIMTLLLEHDRNFPQFENDGEDNRWGDHYQRR